MSFYATAHAAINSYADGTVHVTGHGQIKVLNERGASNAEIMCTVNLSPAIITVLEWAEAKMKEEQKLKVLIEACPAIAEAKRSLDTLTAMAGATLEENHG